MSPLEILLQHCVAFFLQSFIWRSVCSCCTDVLLCHYLPNNSGWAIHMEIDHYSLQLLELKVSSVHLEDVLFLHLDENRHCPSKSLRTSKTTTPTHHLQASWSIQTTTVLANRWWQNLDVWSECVPHLKNWGEKKVYKKNPHTNIAKLVVLRSWVGTESTLTHS